MGKGIRGDWKAVVYRGIESEELDYKAATNWRELSRYEKAKFVRHCLALANTKGGYIVVGVGEDTSGKPALYTGLTDEQLKSFDPTDVGNFINHRSDPPIDFDIVRPEVDGKSYVIFVVRRFTHLPHVCTHSSEQELQQGCFYIRTKDASSRVAYRASEVHDLVQRALRNQREVLGRMLRGILYENSRRPEPLAESLFNEELRHAEDFLTRNGKGVFTKGPCLEIQSRPAEFHETAFNLPDVRGAVEDSLMTFHDRPWMVFGNPEEAYYTNLSLRSLSRKEKAYFQAFRSGLFHYKYAISQKENRLSGDDLIHHVVGGVFFLANYYGRLGYDDELLLLTFQLDAVDGKALLLDLPGRSAMECVSRIPKIRIELKRSAADLFAGVEEHATRVLMSVLLRFNVREGLQGEIRKQVHDYLSRRV